MKWIDGERPSAVQTETTSRRTSNVSITDPAERVSMEEIERRYITHVLDATGGNQTQAARIGGLDRKTIYRKLKPDDHETT